MQVRWAWLPLVLLLTACASGPQRDPDQAGASAAFEERSKQLTDWDDWGFTARLSIDDGDEGGSGRLDWIAREDGSTLRFRGALGQGAWQLEMDTSGATLSLADGTIRKAPDVGDLVERETGWPVPVDDLAWWVRGLPAPGSGHQLDKDPEGLAEQLVQSGWTIRFERYSDFEDLAMPSRLEASRDNVRVKLAISRWWHNDGAG